MKTKFIPTKDLGLLHQAELNIIAATTRRLRKSELNRFIGTLRSLRLIDNAPVEYVGTVIDAEGETGLLIVQGQALAPDPSVTRVGP